ncbi:uncharacterized protein LOC132922462 [Rhopalosiphum padi]|uniref:uncharacterized protein LOC132922462 n=1 Tax=Rhopalosiphum padi TaxID=40932 RepID=UPI00298E2B87|nr:uncharacterized protein LOC132922462 [Rhopalosiphum padi]
MTFLLSYAVVSVFVFTVQLHFFYLGPVHSIQNGTNYTTCQECIDSECYKTDKHACVLNDTDNTYLCFTCDTDTDGNSQFYSETACKASCADEHKCTCDGACYKCFQGVIPDHEVFTCTIPTEQMDDNCNKSPYQPPSS